MTETSERARLSRETVIDGAIELADTEGLDALTIRRLAERLGVTPMALYWHYKNKDELLAGLVNRMWSEVDTSVDPECPWIDRFRSLMVSLVNVMRAHPAIAPLVMETEPEAATACFDTMEVALELLRSAGFTPQESADICRHGLRTAVTLAVGRPGFRRQHEATEAAAEALRHKRVVLQSLPPSRYPHVVEAAEPFTACADPDAYYAFGIDLFIAGIETLHARRY